MEERLADMDRWVKEKDGELGRDWEDSAGGWFTLNIHLTLLCKQPTWHTPLPL